MANHCTHVGYHMKELVTSTVHPHMLSIGVMLIVEWLYFHSSSLRSGFEATVCTAKGPLVERIELSNGFVLESTAKHAVSSHTSLYMLPDAPNICPL